MRSLCFRSIILVHIVGGSVLLAGECAAPVPGVGTVSRTCLVELLIAAICALAIVSAYALRQAAQLNRRLKATEAKFLAMSAHDPLTGLPNLPLFTEFARKVLANAKRHGSLFSLVSMDLTGVDAVHTEHGREVGDRLIQAAARRIEDAVRQGDLVARVEGSRFIVLLDSIRGRSGLPPVITRLVAAIAAPYTINGKELAIGCSAGVSLFPQDTDAWNELVAKADEALGKAKLTGQSHGMFYDEVPPPVV